jgi:hypothetical protein
MACGLTWQHALLLAGDTEPAPSLTNSVEGHVYSLQLAAVGVGLGDGDGLQQAQRQQQLKSK